MKSKLFASIAFLFLTLASCEDVIEIQPGTQQALIAVEGVIVNKAGESFVLLSTTKPYFTTGSPAPVTHASVAVSDDQHNVISFGEAEPGRYIGPADFAGVPGRTYSLSVEVYGQVVTAQSTMPDSVEFSNVRLEYIGKNDVDKQEGHYLYGTLSSDDTESSYFKSEVYVNGIRRQKTAADLQIFDDRYFSGLGNIEGTFGHWTNDDRLEKNDVINIRVYTLSKPAYDYLKALKDTPSQGGLYGRNPANVPSNIHGGLGLFQATAYTTSPDVTVE